jgi:hypothetical protein
VNKGASHQIISCNMHNKDGKHQLWVERPSGKTLKIVESKDINEVQIVKDAIDHCIKNGIKSLKID